MIYNKLVDYTFLKSIEQFIKNGSKINRNELISRLDKVKIILKNSKDKNLEEIKDEICKRYYEICDDAVNVQKFAPGISSSIYLSNDFGITTHIGKTSNQKNAIDIDDDILFDIASITKQFTLGYVIHLHEKGQINIYDRVNKINPNFSKINIRLVDLFRFNYEIRTPARIDERNEFGKFKNDMYGAKRLLRESKVIKKKYIYSDIPYMIVAELIPNFEKGLLLFIKDLDMNNTIYNPFNIITTGGFYNDLNIVHDPKAQIMNGVSGHAGLFSTSYDLTKMLKYFMNLKKEYIREISKIRDYRDKYNNDNKMGMMYIKHPLGLGVSEVPHLASYHSVARTGFTGGWTLYDLDNEYTANFLSNPLSDSDVIKDERYIYIFDYLKEELLTVSFMFKIANEVLLKYHRKEELQKTYIKKL